jgi:23S rRNA pseudouridine1911/1915/1917 synthase
VAEAERVRVPREAAGLRLDRFLAGLEAVGSRAAAERLIAAGAVTVDGAGGAKSLRLQGGEEVAFTPVAPEPGPAAADLGLPVVYEDPWLLVVDKPPGVVTHPAAGVHEPTLVEGLLARGIAGGDDPERPGIVHRLDRDTSGLLVVARDDATQRTLAEALRARRIDRRYLALVHGRPPSLRGTIDAPIGRDPMDIGRMAVDGRRARPAVTRFESLEALRHHTLLRVALETGRTHQIRVHLAAIRHPVVGDPLYGRGGAELGLDRQFLHAAELAFDHPQTGERIEVASVLPEDLAAALARAREGAR